MRQARGGDPVPAEAALQAAWAALRGPQRLTTAEGEHIRVLFPGIANPGAGPDFRGAVIATERGRLVRGDVEVHRHEAGWREHGHQHDGRYDQVVLHVVAGAGGASVTELPGGRRVPVARLSLPAPAAADPEGHPCSGCALGQDAAAMVPRLAVLGLQRLHRKAVAWQRLEGAGQEAAFAAACLEMLTGPRNRAAMRGVAVALGPAWAAAEASLAALQHQLLQVARLSPPKGWQATTAQPVLDTAAASGVGWDYSGCRPAAHPARRLLGAAVWYQRWGAAGGPTAWLAGQPASHAALTAAFMVPAAAALLNGPAPVGRERAAAIVVNVVYPWLLARALRGGDPAAVAIITEAWGATAALEPDTVVRSLTGALGLTGAGLKAGHQQGLHHLYRRCCRRGRQAHCLLRSSPR